MYSGLMIHTAPTRSATDQWDELNKEKLKVEAKKKLPRIFEVKIKLCTKKHIHCHSVCGQC